jgi:hypothetical protein
MNMDNHKLVALAKALQHKAPHEVDEVLRQKRLDPQERLSVKVHLSAGAAPRRRVQAQFQLATDTAVYAPPQERPRTEMQRLLDRVGVDDQRTYTEAELNTLLANAGLDVETRLVVKIEAEARGLLRHETAIDRVLQQLEIEAPLSLVELEQRLDRHGISSLATRTAIRAECQQRGWLRMRARSMRAAAVLKGRDGKPLTLRSRP